MGSCDGTQTLPRRAIPHLRSEAEARRTPCPRDSGQEELPHVQVRGHGREEILTPEVRSGGREEQPHVQGAVVAWAQEGLEELLHVQGQEGGSEEIPIIQGKEQWLRFAGAAVKR